MEVYDRGASLGSPDGGSGDLTRCNGQVGRHRGSVDGARWRAGDDCGSHQVSPNPGPGFDVAGMSPVSVSNKENEISPVRPAIREKPWRKGGSRV